MGTGSSRGRPSGPAQPVNGNTGPGGGAVTRNRTRADGWVWFEINFNDMELADDSEDETNNAEDGTAEGGKSRGRFGNGHASSNVSTACSWVEEKRLVPHPAPDAPAATADGTAEPTAPVTETEPTPGGESTTEPAASAAPVPAEPSKPVEPAAPAKPATSAIPENLPSLSVTGVKYNVSGFLEYCTRKSTPFS